MKTLTIAPSAENPFECDLFFPEGEVRALLLQPVQGDFEDLAEEVRLIENMSGRGDFAFAGIRIPDPNKALSPWEAEPVFGNEGFGKNAETTLGAILSGTLPAIQKTLLLSGEETLYLGGYSLSAFFCLWAGYRTDTFAGIGAASPSVWFPGWDEYIGNNPCLAGKVYLSLGDKEKKTKNRTMRCVEDRIRLQEELLKKQGVPCTLQFQPGNHFSETERRKAEAFAWLLEE